MCCDWLTAVVMHDCTHTACFYFSMYVKEVLLLMTRSAIDKDGSHHQRPSWDYFKADKFTLMALWAFSPILF